MTMESLPSILFNVQSSKQEWFIDDTIRVRVTGIYGVVTPVGEGTYNEDTIIVDKTGIIGNTMEIPAP